MLQPIESNVNGLITYPTIYALDNNSRVRVWYAQLQISTEIVYIRNVSGLEGGKLVESGWKQMEIKNVGRSNETCAEQQGRSEIQSLYKKQLAQGGYHESKETINQSTYTAPMLAQKYGDVASKVINFNDLMWSQPKLDGHRCVASEAGLFTRKGKPFKSVPHIYQLLWPVFQKFPGIILDGELYNHKLKDDFNQISSLVRKSKPDQSDLEKTDKLIQYHIYDVVAPKLTQQQRFDLLDQVFAIVADPAIVAVNTQNVCDQETLDQLYATYLEDGYEGQMVRLNDLYKIDQRPNCLIKRKEFIDEEGLILDIIEGEGNWAGAAKSLTIRLKDGIECSSGIRGNFEAAVKLLAEKDKYLQGNGYATIRYFNRTPSGKPRFPVAVDLMIGNEK